MVAALFAATMSGCGTVKTRDTATPPVARVPDSAPAQAKPAPPPGGGYYLNDGPGDNPPPNLDQIADAVPRREPLARGAMRPYTIMGQNYTPMTAIQPYSPPSLRTLKEWISLDRKLFVAWPADRIFKGRFGGSKWRSEAKGKVSAILLDSGSSTQGGGTGKLFDWTKAKTVLSTIEEFDFVVAGGLTPQNVGEAIEILQPWGVDVVSGVEERPGKKDPEKVRAFVKAVREIDRKVG